MENQTLKKDFEEMKHITLKNFAKTISSIKALTSYTNDQISKVREAINYSDKIQGKRTDQLIDQTKYELRSESYKNRRDLSESLENKI